MRIGIFVFDGVQELDAVGPYEVFGTASQLRPDLFDVLTIAESDGAITCVNGLGLLPHATFSSHPPLDIVVIPGGDGTRVQSTRPAVLDWLRQQAKAATWVASVCSGARLTLESGIATGKRITTHHDVVAELRARGGAAEVLEGVRFVRDGNVVHSAGISAGIDMSLWLVGEASGDTQLAHAVRDEMEYYPGPIDA